MAISFFVPSADILAVRVIGEIPELSVGFEIFAGTIKL
jgi:hypothetical protein